MKNQASEHFKGLGTLGIAQYVHRECEGAFLQSVTANGKVAEPKRTRSWTPGELMGRFNDIERCDHCGKPFQPTDSGYVSFWITTAAEIKRVSSAKPWWKFW